MRRGPSEYESEGPRAGRRPAPGRPGDRRDPQVPLRPPHPRRSKLRTIVLRMARPVGPVVPLRWHPQPGGSPLPDRIDVLRPSRPASGAAPGLPRCRPRPRGRGRSSSRVRPAGTTPFPDDFSSTRPCTAPSTATRAPVQHRPHPCGRNSWTTARTLSTQGVRNSRWAASSDPYDGLIRPQARPTAAASLSGTARFNGAFDCRSVLGSGTAVQRPDVTLWVRNDRGISR